mmetsp:Transcript_7805/g.11011  ORF Transcript_7805/g.11011 Transcript_7805/m.11011 type:complete len:127 (+) Transcript_7805:26-406(+)
MNKTITVSGSIIIVLAIILGAFGAHALKERLDAEQLASFETGVRYAMYHGLAFLVLGLTADRLTNLTWVYRLLLGGVILFSGSIFLLSLQSILGVELKFLGPITPIGGVLMIVGWSLFTAAIFKKK